MTTKVSATVQQILKVQRVVLPADATSNGSYRNMSLESLIPAQGYTDSTLPDASEAWAGHIALTAGAASIDLTSLALGGETINFNGKKLRELQVVADAGNASPISIGTGATNGYDEVGTIGNLRPGNASMRHCVGASAVDATHKTLDLAGAGTDGLSLLLVFGDT